MELCNYYLWYHDVYEPLSGWLPRAHKKVTKMKTALLRLELQRSKNSKSR